MYVNALTVMSVDTFIGSYLLISNIEVTNGVNCPVSGLPENDIVPQLKQKLGDFKLCLPIIVALRNPHLRKRHMEEIHKITGRLLVIEATFTLGDMLNLTVSKHYINVYRPQDILKSIF